MFCTKVKVAKGGVYLRDITVIHIHMTDSVMHILASFSGMYKSTDHEFLPRLNGGQS